MLTKIDMWETEMTFCTASAGSWLAEWHVSEPRNVLTGRSCRIELGPLSINGDFSKSRRLNTISVAHVRLIFLTFSVVAVRSFVFFVLHKRKHAPSLM